MGRPKRRIQQCREIAKKRKIQIAKSHDDTNSNDSNDILDLDNEVNTDDEVGWVDEDEAKQLFLVLTKNMKELKLSKRPLVNIGNSRTTKYRQKVKALENRKKNGQTLYQLLNNHNTGGSSGGNFGDGSSGSDSSSVDFGGGSSGGNFGGGSSSGDSSGVDFGGGSPGGNFGGGSSDDGDGSNSDGSNNDDSNGNSNDTDKIITNAQFNALINIIEDKLKLENEYLTPGYKLRLKAVQHYLQLLNKGHAKLKASQTIADLLNRGIWFARCVRSWAKAFIEYGDVLESNHGKHLRGSSILDDEDVQLKVTSYLQQHKFDTTVHNFCDYISNEILPSVGIEEKTKIRYLFYNICIYGLFYFINILLKIFTFYSKSTAIRWLKKMGFVFSQYTKGMYIDGHERDDVIAYRKEFLEIMSR